MSIVNRQSPMSNALNSPNIITMLSEQVQGALWELLHGYQKASIIANNDEFNQMIQKAPKHIYGGLLTFIMRLVFLVYAEENDLLPNHISPNLSVIGLYEKLHKETNRNKNSHSKVMGTNTGIPAGSFFALWSDIKKRSYYVVSNVTDWPNRKLPSWNLDELI